METALLDEVGDSHRSFVTCSLSLVYFGSWNRIRTTLPNNLVPRAFALKVGGKSPGNEVALPKI